MFQDDQQVVLGVTYVSPEASLPFPFYVELEGSTPFSRGLFFCILEMFGL